MKECDSKHDPETQTAARRVGPDIVSDEIQQSHVVFHEIHKSTRFIQSQFHRFNDFIFRYILLFYDIQITAVTYFMKMSSTPSLHKHSFHEVS